MKTKLLSLLLVAIGSVGASQASPALYLKKNISFVENWNRYPSPDTILSTLLWQFPLADAKRIQQQCLTVTTDTHALLGGNFPSTGEAGIQTPNSGFIVWYMGCTKDFITAEQQGYYELYRSAPNAASVERYLGKKMAALCPMDYRADSAQYKSKCDWSALPLPARRAAIVEQIERLVGPDDVIRDSGIASSSTELAKKIDESMLAVIAKNPNAFDFVQVRAPTSYYGLEPLSAVRAIRYLILLVDTLKY